MDDQRSILSPTDTAETLAGSGFRNAQNHLVGAFTTTDFRSAVQLLDAVAVVADELNHHPDVRLGWGRVEFALTSHDVGGVTSGGFPRLIGADRGRSRPSEGVTTARHQRGQADHARRRRAHGHRRQRATGPATEESPAAAGDSLEHPQRDSNPCRHLESDPWADFYGW